MRIGILGGGSFGTALAKVLSDAGRDVVLWCHNAQTAETTARTRENSTYLAGVQLPDALKVTNDIQEAVSGRDYLVAMGPSHVLRDVMLKARPHVRGRPLLVSAAKGIEEGSCLRMSEVLDQVFGTEFADRIAVLSGPSFAREIAAEMPTAVTAAARHSSAVEEVLSTFRTKRFRVYSSTDLVGVEVGGAAKNVIAIAAGISDGLGLGSSSRAALITRGVAEIGRLVRDLGGDTRTVSGLSGVGDIVLTCTGDLSRNRTVGMRIGKGETLAAITSQMKMIAEGVHNSKSVCDLANRAGTEMPIAQGVRMILHEGKPPRVVLEEFMRRDPKPEF